MTSKIFFDTNVIAYIFDRSNPSKRDLAKDVVSSCMRTGAMVVSTQVLQEVFIVLTGRLKPAIPVDVAAKAMKWLARNEVAIIRPETIQRAVRVLRENRISFWDSLIVSCALESRCEVLFTEDLQHGQVISGVRISNPLQAPGA
ncbi:MAG: PIN domain-containing protein [Syntrophobacteraceae bacterium]